MDNLVDIDYLFDNSFSGVYKLVSPTGSENNTLTRFVVDKAFSQEKRIVLLVQQNSVEQVNRSAWKGEKFKLTNDKMKISIEYE